MSIIQKALANLDTIKDQVPIWAMESIMENADFIISILQDNQLSKGLDSSGTVVGTYFWTTEYQYARDPQNRPRKPKVTGSPYNFEWSGEFFDSMNLKVDTKESKFNIFSVTGKDRILEQYFRRDLTTFTKENNDYVNTTIIEPYLAQKIEENMFNF